MKRMKYMLMECLLLCTGLFSCTEETGMPQLEKEAQPIRVALELGVPAPILSRADADALPDVNEENCALFAFDSSGKLLWVHYTEEEEMEHAIYITGNELNFSSETTEESVKLILLANVDIDAIKSQFKNMEAGAAMEALKAITHTHRYNNEGTPVSEYIPMSGELTLENGINENITGTIRLRRSLAKISVQVTYELRDDDGIDITTEGDRRFTPEKIRIYNANATAAVYASGTDAVIPANPEKMDFEIEIPFDENGYAEAFVAETINNYQTPHTDDEPTNGIAVLVFGHYNGPAEGGNGTVEQDCWYRLDMIKDNLELEEVDCLLRNHHYRFVMKNVNFEGHYGDIGLKTALNRQTPHNAHFYQTTDNEVFQIIDEEIFSISSEFFDEENPYYLGVSETNVQMVVGLPTGQRAVERVEVVTNHREALKLDEAGCAGIFTFVREVPEDIGGTNERTEGTVWIWENPGVTKAGTYTFYLYCGNIRKPMTIEVKEYRQ